MPQAMIKSLNNFDEVKVLAYKDNNSVVVKYKGKKYAAVFNPFVSRFYVDDVYGEIKEETPKNKTRRN